MASQRLALPASPLLVLVEWAGGVAIDSFFLAGDNLPRLRCLADSFDVRSPFGKVRKVRRSMKEAFKVPYRSCGHPS
jgi:hypothetical protein